MSSIKVNLKQKILDQAGKEIKLIERTSIAVTGTGTMSIPTNDMSNAKPMKLGDALIDVFSRKITPKNFEDAAELKKWHSRFYNALITTKGTIELDTDQLKEIKEIFDTKADPTKLEIMVDGEVYKIITDYLQRALTKKKD